ncbi:YbaB/EbfC family nucleoid-associated protein [Propionibacteriaceae bacterium G1746]
MTDNPFEPGGEPEDDLDSALESTQVGARRTPDPGPALDTSERSFGAAFDNMAAILPHADEAIGSIPEGSMDDLEVTAESPDGNVVVTVKKAAIESLSVSPVWLDRLDSVTLTNAVKATVNEALERYNEAVVAQLAQVTPKMAEVTRAVDAVRAQIRGAFDDEMARIQNGGTRP